MACTCIHACVRACTACPRVLKRAPAAPHAKAASDATDRTTHSAVGRVAVATLARPPFAPSLLVRVFASARNWSRVGRAVCCQTTRSCERGISGLERAAKGVPRTRAVKPRPPYCRAHRPGACKARACERDSVRARKRGREDLKAARTWGCLPLATLCSPLLQQIFCLLQLPVCACGACARKCVLSVWAMRILHTLV